MIGEYVRVPELVISALLGVTFAAGCSQRAPLKEVHSASHTLTPAGTIELIDDAALVGGVWMSILDDRNELAVTLLRRDTITESELQVRRFALHAPADASQAFSLGGFGYEFSSGGTRPTSDGAQLHYDGQRLLTLVPRWQPSEGQLSVVNALSGDILQVLDWDANTHVYRYAFSPDSTLVAVCGGHPSRHDQGRVMVWELTSGRLILKGENSERAFFTLSFSQDAQLLAAGTYRRDSQDMVYVYGTATRLIRYTLSHPDMMCPWFTPSGLLLTVPVPGSTTWSVWDVSRGEQVNSVSVPLKSGPWGISDIEFTADGELAFVAMSNWNRGQRAGAVFVISLPDMRIAATLLDDVSSEIMDLELSDNGSTLAVLGTHEMWLWSVRRSALDQLL